MASLVVFPRRTDAFSAYRPSRNAHTDILTASSSAHTGKVITLNVKRTLPRQLWLTHSAKAASG
jgi:hypothetical protein